MKRLSGEPLSLVLGLTTLVVVLTVYIPQAISGTILVPGDYATIQDAVHAAVNGDEIVVSPGIYYENISIPSKDITIRSTNPDDIDVVRNTIIDGNRAHSVVTFTGNSACPALRGFTVRNGQSISGGGIDCHALASPTIADCIITGNESTGVNGIDGGGGIYCYYKCNPNIERCIISNNTANNNGGGIYCTASCSPKIIRCTISGNTALGNVYGGGGIYCGYFCTSSIVNCIITENYTLAYGGGIYTKTDSAAAKTEIVNCTVTLNSADGGGKNNGGGLFCAYKGTTATNCIFIDNSKGEIGYSGNYTVAPTVTYSAVKGGYFSADNSNIDLVDPLFIAPGPGGDYRLRAGSPCIDKGTNVDAPRYDLNGEIRPRDGDADGLPVTDMGAYEYIPFTLIEMDQFSAAASGDHITITFSTLSEIDTAGFYIWRTQAGCEEYTRLNPVIIESIGGPALHAEYSYDDDTASPSVMYYYQLEEVDNRGLSTFFGPIKPVSLQADAPRVDYLWGYGQLKDLQSMLWGIQYPAHNLFSYYLF
ncbi:MAG: right-handed parallel beta-helix repeat-containing protein [bacterium]